MSIFDEEISDALRRGDMTALYNLKEMMVMMEERDEEDERHMGGIKKLIQGQSVVPPKVKNAGSAATADTADRSISKDRAKIKALVKLMEAELEVLGDIRFKFNGNITELSSVIKQLKVQAMPGMEANFLSKVLLNFVKMRVVVKMPDGTYKGVTGVVETEIKSFVGDEKVALLRTKPEE